MSVLLVLLLSLLSEGLEGAGVLGHGGKEKQRKEEQWKRKRKEKERDRERERKINYNWEDGKSFLLGMLVLIKCSTNET